MNRITRATARRIDPLIIRTILANLKFAFFIYQNMCKSRHQGAWKSYITRIDCYIIHRFLKLSSNPFINCSLLTMRKFQTIADRLKYTTGHSSQWVFYPRNISKLGVMLIDCHLKKWCKGILTKSPKFHMHGKLDI